MKIVQINATCGSGSTGKICVEISRLLTERGIENKIFYTSGSNKYSLGHRFGWKYEIKLQALKSRIFGNYGFNSKRITERIIEHLKQIQPDVVSLHNIHGHNIHLEMLFSYFKKHPEIHIVWTFHDCWAFTGYCPHFTMAKCDGWKSGCGHCPQWRQYSWFFDRSSTLYERKKALFCGQNMTIITPSIWLADLVKESFLREYPVKVIHNGIDLEVFKPTESDFRERYNLQDKYIVLGVAFGWGPRKGLDVFIELSKRLSERYQIVLVGTDDKVDKILPSNIISIHRTQNQQELAQIYTAADVFVNPTREDNFPTVNIEALACGTPVITFRTGGSPECIDGTCGDVAENDDVVSLCSKVEQICEEKPFLRDACIVHGQIFDSQDKFTEYIDLFL